MRNVNLEMSRDAATPLASASCSVILLEWVPSKSLTPFHLILSNTSYERGHCKASGRVGHASLF